MAFSILSAMRSFDGLRGNRTQKCPSDEMLLDLIFRNLENITTNFRDPELSHCLMYGSTSLTLIQSVALYIRQAVEKTRRGAPLRKGVGRGPRSNQREADLREWRAFSRRAEFLLSDVKRWNTRGLPVRALHQTICPLCSQAIRRGKRI